MRATLALAALAGTAAAMRPASAGGGLQDLAAFPKYEVVFLNDHPLSASDAARCRAEGLVNDDDFLAVRPRSRVAIEAEAANRNRRSEGATGESEGGAADGADGDDGADSVDKVPSQNLELLTLHYTHANAQGPNTYLCALPSANRTAAQTATASQPHDEPEPDPAASWKALSHLDGQCLYARHRWFTYAYCHNRFIRQFREAQQTTPAPPEGYTPKEDPAYDAYTLGHAHPPKRKSSLTGKRKGKSADSPALAPEQTVTLGVGPASRYLVQRWTDGTRCDKTGQPREVEVQVHCSMTSGDAIYMVKEIETCKYVVVIHSPHLCSLPGFRPQTADDIESAPIRCREVVSDEEFALWEAEPEEKRTAAAAAANDIPRLEQSNQANQASPDDKEFALKAGDDKDARLDDDLVKRLEDVLAKAFGGDIPIEIQVETVGDLGEELTPKQVHDDEGDDKPPRLILLYDEDDGMAKPVTADGDLNEDRRAMLQRLQRAIQAELDGEVAAEDEERERRLKDEL